MIEETGRSTTPAPAVGRPALVARRLLDLPLAGLVVLLVVYGGVAIGLASIGGWVGIGAALCVAALMVAVVVLTCDG